MTFISSVSAIVGIVHVTQELPRRASEQLQ